MDKEQLNSGLIIFRRGDVAHRHYYCRIRLAKEDRYKTIALHTSNPQAARDEAFDLDAEVRFKLKHDVPVFNRPFRDVAEEYITTIERRANNGVAAPRQVPQKLAPGLARCLRRQHAGSFDQSGSLGAISNMAARKWQRSAPRAYQRFSDRE
jgi:hypothetical protein